MVVLHQTHCEWAYIQDDYNQNLRFQHRIDNDDDDSNDGGGGGVIINVSSIHGERSNGYMSAYAASKAALDSLTRTMAIEYAQYNIRVNAIAPGVVPVERTKVAFSNPQIMKSWTDKLPLGRTGTVEEVAKAIATPSLYH